MFVKGLLKHVVTNTIFQSSCHRIFRYKKTGPPLSQLMVPLPVKSHLDDLNVGAELTGKLDKEEVMKWLAKFYQRREIKSAATENGIDSEYCS